MKRYSTLLLTLLASISVSQHISAQIAVGPNNGNTFESVAPGSIPFNNPSYAQTSDGNRARASATLTLLIANTQRLTARDFGFAIPAATNIVGIQVEVQKYATNISILAYIHDNSVMLMKDGATTGNSRAKPEAWTATEAYFIYGGPNDLWGTTWEPEDINDPDFGVSFSASITGIATLLPSARVNHIRVTVYYEHIVVPVRLINFHGEAKDDHTAALHWTLGSPNEDPEGIELQRSTDGYNWNSIHRVNDHLNTQFEYTDHSSTAPRYWYRLKIGSSFYSKTIQIGWSQTDPPQIYPSIADNYVWIKNTDASGVISCIDMNGRIHRAPVSTNGNLQRVDVSQLPVGYYYIRLGNRALKFYKRG